MQIPHLENEYVKLSLLDLSNYKHLAAIAEEKDLIYYSPSAISPPEKLKEYVQLAVDAYYHKTAIPFLIYNKKKQAYAGCTRFGLINHKNKVLYIGWTWISKDFQGSGLNTQVKFLMLQYAFETLQFDKVAFKVDERNLRSRKAIEKIGGTFEGLLRKDTRMRDGFKRNTCYYGILKEEWPEIKKTIFNGF